MERTPQKKAILKDKTLCLVDGSNLLYRAFYAIPELSNSKGLTTNAIYGFTTMLMKLLRDHRPDYMAVVFDSKGPTFRHDAFEEYKATREAMPDNLSVQVPYVKDTVRAFSIPVIEKEGAEADDVIGTMAKRAAAEGMNVFIVSGDKDLMQLVTDRIIMLDTMKDKSYDVETVKERFGVPPEKVREILGLAGDTSDNIPGVPGIGEKTARKLVEQYGTLEGVLDNLGNIKGARLRENLEAYADQARMSRELATIRTDLDLDVPLEGLAVRDPDSEALKKLFAELEFFSLLRQFQGEESEEGGSARAVVEDDGFRKVLEVIRRKGAFAFDFLLPKVRRPMDGKPLGIGLSTAAGEAWFVPFSDKENKGLDLDACRNALENLFSDSSLSKTGHDLKRAFIVLKRMNVEPASLDFDTMVAAYLLDPVRRDYGIRSLAARYLGENLVSLDEQTGGGGRALSMDAVTLDKIAGVFCRFVDSIGRLRAILEESIKEEGFERLFMEIEMPLVEVLASMEYHGVLVDREFLAEMSRELGELMKLCEEKIYRLAGEEFNINSPKQLQRILFEKMGMPRGRKTKEGYSTDMEVLAHLAKSYELPGEILAYRSLAKLKSTYVDALPELINPETGRIHTSYNQTVTATGRLSSSDPNLQNIPIRTMEGKRIRQAFIAPEDCKLMSADYSQIELRVLAHLSEDEELIAAFESGYDIHRMTASSVFGVFPEMVNEEMRRQAKVINFGVIYGMSPFGLSKELGISQKMAKTYIDEYFKRFSGVARYVEETIEQARRDGFVTTIMNRKRAIPEINSSVAQLRKFAERTAINTPIQGSAADIIKMAMIRVFRLLSDRGFSARMIMQVHDELVFEYPIPEEEALKDLVKTEMEGVIKLKVPLVVNIKSGKNWDEAH